MVKAKTFWDHFLPSNIDDRQLRLVLSHCSRSTVGNTIATLLTLLLWYPMGSKLIIMTIFAWSAVNCVGLIIMRMGFYNAARYYYFTTTAIFLPLASQLMGIRSFMWVFILMSIAGNSYVTAPSEKALKKYGDWILSLSAPMVLVLHFTNWVPTDVAPAYEPYMVYWGIWNVSYSTVLAMLGRLRFQKENTQYKALLERQSITLLQQAKMSTLGEMAAGVAHEINNPLGIIVGKIESLSKRLSEPEFDREKVLYDFAKVQTVVVRIAKIVSALRSFSRNADKDPFQSAKVQDVIEETLNFCSENLKLSNIEVRISGDTAIAFECRQVQLVQVLVNLLNNSFDAVQVLPEKWISIHSESMGPDRFRLIVKDSGTGIDPKVAAKIMQPFFTTKDIGKGTGLGLSIAKGIVEDHDGTLSLDASSANTCFVIELPLKQQQSELKSAA